MSVIVEFENNWEFMEFTVETILFIKGLWTDKQIKRETKRSIK